MAFPLHIVGAMVASGLALVALRRLVGGLDEAEAALRSVVSEVRTLRRSLAEAVILADGVGSRAEDSHTALHRLQKLKDPAEEGP